LPKFQCNRCREIFESTIQLSDHQRLEIPCETRAEEPRDGIDDAQLQLLRSKKKLPGKKEMSEEEKWTNVYRIIFPNDDPVPSPCGYMHSLLVRCAAMLTNTDHDLSYYVSKEQKVSLPCLLFCFIDSSTNQLEGYENRT
jgi:hypothetical protein